MESIFLHRLGVLSAGRVVGALKHPRRERLQWHMGLHAVGTGQARAMNRHGTDRTAVRVVPLQALAAILGFLARDVVAGTGMGILAATWACVGVIELTGAPGAVSDPLGLLLLVSATALLIPATASLAGKVVPAAVLTCTALRLATTGVHEITDHAA